MSLIYEEKVSSSIRKQFTDKVRSISSKLGIDPNWLMIVMNSESGISSTIPNSIGCVGLIQFCPDTARGSYKTLGGKRVNLNALKAMHPVTQLDYVYKYFYSYRYRMNSVFDLYLVAFYPAAIGKKDSYVIGSKNGDAYARKVGSQNKALDMNKDGYVTVRDFKQFVAKKTAGLSVKKENTRKEKETNFAKRNMWLFITASVVILAGGAIAIVIMNK